LGTKTWLIVGTWTLALLVSYVLKVWGSFHPESFQAQTSIVLMLLFGPSIIFLIWISLKTFLDKDIK
tara:strand:- start:290 stop:490 length:201 start_codon:yes stop_codon:yes gene_type:complete